MTSAPAHRAEPRVDEAPAQTVEPEAAPRVRARHRRWILTTLLSVLLAGAIASSFYLWQVAEAQAERNAEWEAVARDLGEQIAETRRELADTMTELDVVRGQLAQAQDRITELADEKAQLGDEHAVVRQLVDYQERVSQAAGRVATALDNCIEGQQQIIVLLDADTEYTEEQHAEIADFAGEVEAVCQSAREANEALQEELDE